MEANKIISFLATTGAILLTTTLDCTVRRASATTSTPSSSTEICLLESAICFDAGVCWDCVAQLVDAADCAERYPVLADEGASNCEVGAAMLCCSFDASVEDCLGDAVTMDYFQCGLDESGCTLSDSPCSSGDGSPAVAPTPTSPPTPPPNNEVDTNPPENKPSDAPTMSPVAPTPSPIIPPSPAPVIPSTDSPVPAPTVQPLFTTSAPTIETARTPTPPEAATIMPSTAVTETIAPIPQATKPPTSAPTISPAIPTAIPTHGGTTPEPTSTMTSRDTGDATIGPPDNDSSSESPDGAGTTTIANGAAGASTHILGVYGIIVVALSLL